MDILSQTALLVALTSFGLASSVLARNIRNKVFISFAVLSFLICIWALSFTLSRILGPWTYTLHLLSNIWLAPSALILVGLMLRTRDPRSEFLVRFSFGLGVILTAALVMGMDSNPFWKYAILLSPGQILVQIAYLAWKDLRRVETAHRRKPSINVRFGQRSLIYLGAILVLSTSVMDHFLWTGPIVPSVGNVALTIYLFFLSQAISQQRLLNFESLLARFFILLTVALTLTAVYSLVFAWIEESLPLFFLNSFIISFLVLMLIDPIRRLVLYLTNRLLRQGQKRMEEALTEAQGRLSGILESETLYDELVRTTRRVMEPQRFSIYVLNRAHTRYQRVREVGYFSKEKNHHELRADHPLLVRCVYLMKKSELPILLDQVLESEIDRSVSQSEKQGLRALVQDLHYLQSNLLIPLLDLTEKKALGFLAIYVPAPPEPWKNNWGMLHRIYPYYEQAAQALQSMAVYDEQREKERLATLGEMAAGLAHEIRNPLGAIKGAAQFLDSDGKRKDAPFLRAIIEEVNRLDRVVKNFLDYSKPNTLQLQRLDLNELLKKTLDVLHIQFPRSEIQCHFSKEPAWVRVEPDQIQQVLINLVRNSVKASQPKEKAQIQLSVQLHTQTVSLTVQDWGQGISREGLSKVFIPFFTDSPEGTGLGLAISQKIIKSHGGEIQIESEKGEFTRVMVTLPLSLRESQIKEPRKKEDAKSLHP